MSDSITKLTLIKIDGGEFADDEKGALQLLHDSIIDEDEEELQIQLGHLHLIQKAHITIDALKYFANVFELSDLVGFVDLNDDDPNNEIVIYLRILVFIGVAIEDLMKDIDNFNDINQRTTH